MSNFNDFLKSKIDLLTNELIEKIQNDNPLATDIFLKKTFEIDGVTTFRWTQKLSLHAVSLENEKE